MSSQKTLGPRTRQMLDVLGDRVIPSGGPEFPGAADMNVSGKIIGDLSQMPFGIAGLKALLWWWEFSPFIFSLYFKRFSRMRPDQQILYLKKWEQSRWFVRRYVFLGIKGLFMVAFYNMPAVWEKIGYKEECLVQDSGSGK